MLESCTQDIKSTEGWHTDVRRFGPKIAPLLRYTIGLIPLNGLVLDVGCGRGYAYNWFQSRREDIRYIGIDKMESEIAVAREMNPHVRYEVADVLDFNVHADVVVASRVLCHYQDPAPLIEHMKTLADHVVVSLLCRGHSRIEKIEDDDTYRWFRTCTLDEIEEQWNPDVVKKFCGKYALAHWYGHSTTK
jgi:SAM-dependent methyltransferase